MELDHRRTEHLRDLAASTQDAVHLVATRIEEDIDWYQRNPNGLEQLFVGLVDGLDVPASYDHEAECRAQEELMNTSLDDTISDNLTPCSIRGIELNAALVDASDIDDVLFVTTEPPEDSMVIPDLASLSLPCTRQEGLPTRRVGNLYEEQAMLKLRKYALYCCINNGCDWSYWKPNELLIYRTTVEDYVVMYTSDIPNFFISTLLVHNPDFNLPMWYRKFVADDIGHEACKANMSGECTGYALADGAARLLNRDFPWPTGDAALPRFLCEQGNGYVVITDNYLLLWCAMKNWYLENVYCDIANLYARGICRLLPAWSLDDLDGEIAVLLNGYVLTPEYHTIELNAAMTQAPISTITRTAVVPKDFKRVIPEPIVVVIHINGQPTRALIDSGSLAEFMSTKLAHQLDVKPFELEKPLPVQLAVQGSRTKINYGCNVHVAYQSISETQYFDIANLLSYDLILGTPFLYQHKVTLGFNPTSVLVDSPDVLPMRGKGIRILASRAADLFADSLEQTRCHLRSYAAPICADASDSPFPLLRAINHIIPLKDETKIYSWRPAKCPDAHRASWVEKRDGGA